MLESVSAPAVREALKRQLEPLLGPLMAGAAIRSQCEKLGIEGPHMSGDDVAKLVGALAKGTRVFAGARRTDEVFSGLAERVMKETQGG